MRLFGRRNSQPEENPNSPAHENLQLARASLAQGDATECLRLLGFGFGADSTLKPLYEVARQALQQLQAPEEAALFERALSDFGSAKPFYDLGYHFVGVGSDRLAIPFLERAHALAPGDIDIANELCLALCGQFQPARGADVLAQVLEPLDSRPFWPWFQLQWARLLTNQPTGIAEWITESRAVLSAAGLSEEQRANTGYVLDKLEAALHRLQSVPDPRPLVQDWHFIQYGAAILDYMDDSVTEGGLEVAGGRHVATWGQVGDVRRVLEKLKQFLDATGQKPQVVIALEDRDSQIIALAAAQVLALPYEIASAQNIGRAKALIVAGDNRAIDWNALRVVAQEQVLFAFSHHWLAGSAVTPDISGLMAQSYYLPWNGNAMRVDPETHEVTRSEPDERDPSEIAAEIARATFEPDPRWPEILGFYASRREMLSNSVPGKPRLPFITDSPVPGSFFC